MEKINHKLIQEFIKQNVKLEFASAGDCHGDLSRLKKFTEDCLAENELSLIIATGDYQRQPTKNYSEARRNIMDLFSNLKKCSKKILVLGGNYEIPGVTADCALELGEPFFSIGSTYSNEENRHPGNYMYFQGFHFIGVEGSNPINGLFPGEREENELEWALEKAIGMAKRQLDFNRTILVTHSPPYDCGSRDQLGCFGLPTQYWGKHVGSKAYQKFIFNQKPLIHVCGHVHEGVGLTLYVWNKKEHKLPFEDIRMGEYEKIAILYKKNTKRVTLCVNHGTLEHWMYMRYRIAETENYIGIEVAKRRLGGKDALSKLIDKVAMKKIYKRIIFLDVSPSEILSW
ncbi:MAG: metallophosphoesterase [Candidatus Aenigmatarchaeota archaeon]